MTLLTVCDAPSDPPRAPADPFYELRQAAVAYEQSRLGDGA